MARYATNWEPMRDLMSLQNDMNSLMGALLPNEVRNAAGTWPPFMDVSEGEDAFQIEVDLPGVTPDDVEVTLDQNLLTIRGERKTRNDTDTGNVHRSERRYGEFSRTISLPSHVDADGIQAHFELGVLHVTVPKAEQAKPRRIKVGEARRQIEA